MKKATIKKKNKKQIYFATYKEYIEYLSLKEHKIVKNK